MANPLYTNTVSFCFSLSLFRPRTNPRALDSAAGAQGVASDRVAAAAATDSTGCVRQGRAPPAADQEHPPTAGRNQGQAGRAPEAHRAHDAVPAVGTAAKERRRRRGRAETGSEAEEEEALQEERQGPKAHRK